MLPTKRDVPIPGPNREPVVSERETGGLQLDDEPIRRAQVGPVGAHGDFPAGCWGERLPGEVPGADGLGPRIAVGAVVRDVSPMPGDDGPALGDDFPSASWAVASGATGGGDVLALV